MASQRDSFPLKSLMKWHSLVDVTIPFFSALYSRGDDLSGFPFDFIEPVTDSIGAFMTQWAINQDTVENALRISFHYTDTLLICSSNSF